MPRVFLTAVNALTADSCLLSLHPQRRQRIDPRGAARGQVAGGKADAAQEQARRQHRQRIAGPHFEQQRLQESRADERAGEAARPGRRR